MKVKTIQPSLISLVDLNHLYDGIIANIKAKSQIKNKYLYLGWHGAKAWKNVDSSYMIGDEGLQLINDNFIKIDQIVRADSKFDKRYNIISLGSGTCQEDVKILDVLLKSGMGVFPAVFYNINISIDLLTEGVKTLANKVNGHPKLLKEIEDIVPINLDIEHLTQFKEIFTFYNKNQRTNLFHLLGLTLGNNDECAFLHAIHQAMQCEDYLLLGVDFCADEQAMIETAKNKYYSEEITETINEYICSPLIFASKYKKDEHSTRYKFDIDEFSELEILFEVEKNKSNIPETISFVYYYGFPNGPFRMEACYSHKYKSIQFKEYVEMELPRKGIYFELIGDICGFGNKYSGQYLVLLKKSNNLAPHILPNRQLDYDQNKSYAIGVLREYMTSVLKSGTLSKAYKDDVQNICNKMILHFESVIVADMKMVYDSLKSAHDSNEISKEFLEKIIL